MILRQSGKETDITIEDFNNIHSVDMYVIDYNTRGFFEYEYILNIINEYYLEICKCSINNELFKAIEKVIEGLNNLNHFVTKLKDYRTTDEFVDAVLNKFDTFSYKKLCEFNKSSDFKINKVNIIDEIEFNIIKNLNHTERSSLNTNAYLLYVNKEMEGTLISNNNSRNLISIVQKDNPKYLIKEYATIIHKLIPLGKDNMFLDNYIYFDMSTWGFHKEILHIANMYLNLLAYIINSTSYRENDYLIFDKMTIENRMINLNDFLPRMKEYVANSINSDRRTANIR